MDVDLRKLANMPGAGSAAKALREAGHPLDPEDKGDEWEVEVEYSIGYRDIVSVTAFSARDAEQKARQKVQDFPGFGAVECVEIYSTEASNE